MAPARPISRWRPPMSRPPNPPKAAIRPAGCTSYAPSAGPWPGRATARSVSRLPGPDAARRRARPGRGTPRGALVVLWPYPPPPVPVVAAGDAVGVGVDEDGVVTGTELCDCTGAGDVVPWTGVPPPPLPPPALLPSGWGADEPPCPVAPFLPPLLDPLDLAPLGFAPAAVGPLVADWAAPMVPPLRLASARADGAAEPAGPAPAPLLVVVPCADAWWLSRSDSAGVRSAVTAPASTSSTAATAPSTALRRRGAGATRPSSSSPAASSMPGTSGRSGGASPAGSWTCVSSVSWTGAAAGAPNRA